ncbi:FtsK/SpoIIIE family DNA translocase [Terrihabitans soli]|nr:DNA translocase FtsK 4TM domain-containing protein [Terrihabitans soli]
MREALSRRAWQAGGVALTLAVGAAAVSLVSWSAQDPSFNNAVDGEVRNLLGTPGALLADVLMQTFGLGAVALLFVPASWGWRLALNRTLDREKLRLFAWLLAALFAASFAESLPDPDHWPLPGGVGGIVGHGLAGSLAGFFPLSGVAGMMFSAVLGLGALGFSLVAAGFFFHDDNPEFTRLQRKAAKQAREEEDEEEDVTEDEDEEEEPEDEEEEAEDPADLFDFEEERGSGGFAPVGLIVHYWLALKSGFLRMLRGGAFMHTERDAGRVGMRDLLRRLDGHEPDPDEDEEEDPEEDEAEEEEEAEEAPRRRRVRRAEAAPYDPDTYETPPINLLAAVPKRSGAALSKSELEENARMLESVLEDYGVKGEIIDARPGPVVTLYELEPAAGIKASRVIGLADDIARSMSATAARVAVVPGRNVIGIELPNPKRETVFLRELLAADEFDSSQARLPLCLGKTIGGEPVIAELARMPHLLIAGTTGSGKSVAINTMILSLLYRLTPEECRLIMIDPKMLELSVYDGIPHLLAPVVTDPKKAVVALKWAVREMEERYKKMSKVGVRNIDGFNARVEEAAAKGEVIHRTVQTGFDKKTGEAIYEREEMELDKLPFIVVIVDEMADLMMVAGKEIEGAIQRLAQMARAAGIHIIMATQRPSVDVITGTIKANFPTRISFQVTSKIDSRTILGEQGAEQLLGQGDMLYMQGGGRIGRVHGPFCSDAEVEKVVRHLKAQGAPSYLEAVTTAEDEGEGEDGAVFDKGAFGAEGSDLYDQAVAVVLRDKKCSTSYIQRRLQIGYNRAASLVERMEEEGVVSPANHAGKREILLEA